MYITVINPENTFPKVIFSDKVILISIVNFDNGIVYFPMMAGMN